MDLMFGSPRLLGLCYPFLRISVSVEYDSLMLDRIFLDQIMYCKYRKSSAFSRSSQASENASATMVFNTTFGCSNGILGTNHTELKLVSGKSKR